MIPLRARYQHYLDELHGDVVRLGEKVHLAWERTLKSMDTGNVVLAGWVIDNDREIDDSRRYLEERAITMLATQQPIVGHDLRLLATVSTLAGELERIGDYARSVARRVRLHPNLLQRTLGNDPQWARMTELARYMVQICMDALLAQNTELAMQLAELENEVDTLRHTLRGRVIEQMRADPSLLDVGIEMLEIITVLERTADRTTNIGENIIFLVEGEYKLLNPDG
ncbi:MAG: phosphate signaling complex protein PhoU [Chloroflexaceae bacterium]|nr:phosphate signaling complex protein PhoU [Chloroflexaceae bacterium]